ncbi:MAG: hypothetical protein Kow0060_02830 [Methylohalobius crimeensis]
MTSAPFLTESLRRHVYRLADEIGERNVFHPLALKEAENYLADTWQALGFPVQRQVYEVEGVPSTNLEVTLPGRDHDQILVVGAHYDSVLGCPGANDNGSGVAVLLELCRLLQSLSLPRFLSSAKIKIFTV